MPPDAATGQARRPLVCVTVAHAPADPDASRIDWDRDVLEPTARLLDACEARSVPATLMADVGAYLRLRAQAPDVAAATAAQWRVAVARGHDVQVLLDGRSLARVGAIHGGGGWRWDAALLAAHGLRSGLDGFVADICAVLREGIGSADPAHAITAVRITGGASWPFRELSQALIAAGISCDTSACRDAFDTTEHGLAYSRHQPWFASRSDARLKAPPAERDIVELPIAALKRERMWSADAPHTSAFAAELVEFQARAARASPAARVRLQRAGRAVAAAAYLRSPRRAANRLFPASLGWWLVERPQSDALAEAYFVLAASAPARVDPALLAAGLRSLADQAHAELVTLTAMAGRARASLTATARSGVTSELSHQVERNYDNVMGEERNVLQSEHLQRLVPNRVERLLDLGCGTGDWSRRLADERPGCEVVGVDIGLDFIERARERFGDERVSFAVEDATALSFADRSFDCIYADNSLEHMHDVDATLAEAHRVLREDGVLVAAIPSDARNPDRPNASHTWKTAPRDVRERLAHAGFRDVEIEETDSYRRFAITPYEPSRNLVMFVRATRPRD